MKAFVAYFAAFATLTVLRLDLSEAAPCNDILPSCSRRVHSYESQLCNDDFTLVHYVSDFLCNRVTPKCIENCEEHQTGKLTVTFSCENDVVSSRVSRPFADMLNAVKARTVEPALQIQTVTPRVQK